MSEQFPDHWTSRRLKRAVDLVNDRTDTGTGSYVGLEHIESWTGRLLDSAVEDESGGATSRFQPGDILFGKLRPYLAKVVHAQVWGCCSPELLVLRPRIHDPHYLQYVLLTDEFIHRVNATTYGSKMPRANWADIGDLVIPVPSMSDQRAIADFLDEKTAAIDALIAKKERLIDLIEEKRQATITRAVTKGLDPDVPMKDSGVEWIAEVPDHWRIFRLKHLGREPFQYGANEAGLSDDPEAPRFIRITDLRADGGLRDDTFKSLAEEVARPYLLAHDDILFARSGATVGKAVRYRAAWGRACFAGYLIRFRPDERIVSSAFIEYYTQSGAYREEVGASTVQATIQNVSAQKFGEFRIAVPPLVEQARIVAELDLVNRRTRNVVRSLELHMARLREYRQTLISAAVTGQIDVRSGAARTVNVLEEALA